MKDQFIGQILADKYRIEAVWRESGLGKIYHGIHLLMDKPVAVKILSPVFAVDENIVRRFSEEARTISHISHPNILNVTDFGAEKDGDVFIVFEDAAGETLKETIGQEGAFSWERAVKIAGQIASALSAAHTKEIIHRSLNSENIILARAADDSETIKILEFGSVKMDENKVFDEDFSVKDVEYLSPEQCSQASEPDERSDVYSLGVILYEMLAGEVPFSGETPTDLMLKHAQEPPAPLSAFRSDLPDEIEPIVLRALAKNPEMRYQTAHEFLEDLNRMARNFDEAETSAAAKTAGENPNNIWKTAFIVLAGISILAVGMIYGTYSRRTDPATTLQTDANGQPVQPLNPATGLNEQSLSNMMTFSQDFNSNTAMEIPPGTIPDGGDGYNPWANGVQPPPGAPPQTYVDRGGQIITIDPNNPNQIIPPDGIILVPINPTPTPQVSPTPKGKASPTPDDTPTVPTDNQETPAEAKPTPGKTATPKTTEQPKTTPKATPPASTEKKAQSGKPQDT